jgi:hypothetical protein
VGLSKAPTGGLKSTTTMADRQFRKRLSAIDVWKTRMPIRTTSMHSLKRLTEWQKSQFDVGVLSEETSIPLFT